MGNQASAPSGSANAKAQQNDFIDTALTRAQSTGRLEISRRKIDTLPPKLLQALASLSITQISLWRDSLQSLPEAFFSEKMSQTLLSVDISQNFLTSLPNSLCACVKLTNLCISGNPIAELPAQFSQLTSLSTLDIRGTKIGRTRNNSASLLPESIAQLSALNSLTMSGCDVSGFPDSFFMNLTGLTRLSADDCAITQLPTMRESSSGSTVYCYAPSGCKLRDLSLLSNHIQSIPADFCSAMQSLALLFLSGNQIREIPPQISNLVSLEELHLSDNMITSVPHELALMHRLTTLDLSKNRISHIPETISALTKLTKLSLHGNRIEDIPSASFAGMNALRALHLGANRLQSLPASLYNLISLQVLNVGYNQLTHIDSQISALTNLNILILSSNRLSGPLPNGICALSLLQRLHIAGNNFDSLSDEIGRLSYMVDFSLWGNRISALPESIITSTWSRLRSLDFSINQNLDRFATSFRHSVESETKASRDDEVTPITLEILKSRFPNLEEIQGYGNHVSEFNQIFFNSLHSAEESDCVRDTDSDCSLQKPCDSNLAPMMFDVGCAEMKGVRPTMEDAVVIQRDILRKYPPQQDSLKSETNHQTTAESSQSASADSVPRMRCDIFGVFDGHGGSSTATLAASSIGSVLSQRIHSLTATEKIQLSRYQTAEELDECKATWNRIIHETLIELNEMIRSHHIDDGATMAFVVLVNGTLCVSTNVGDSRVVLGSIQPQTRPLAESSSAERASAEVILTSKRLSHDHKPNQLSEKLRIEALGGCVVNGRVLDLAVSRSLGDLSLAPFVSCEPFVSIHTLTDNDAFILVACDGFWDEVSDDEATEITVQFYNEMKERPTDRWQLHNLAARLRDYAFCKQSTDNISVLVVPVPNSTLFEPLMPNY